MDLPTAGLQLRPHLLAAGVTDGELQRLRRARNITRIRRGAYLPADDERLRTPEARHALLVRATVAALAAGSVMSHASAAVLHGLPLWNVDLGRVHVTPHGAGGGRISRGVHLHVAPLDPSEVDEVDGIAVTSVARTVLDLARSVPFTQAVVVADGALHRKAIDLGALRAAGGAVGAVARRPPGAARRGVRERARGEPRRVAQPRGDAARRAAATRAAVDGAVGRLRGGHRQGRLRLAGAGDGG